MKQINDFIQRADKQAVDIMENIIPIKKTNAKQA